MFIQKSLDFPEMFSYVIPSVFSNNDSQWEYPLQDILKKPPT